MSEDLAERVRARLEELNLTPAAATRAAGLGRTYIYDLLAGKVATIRSDNIAKLASALQVSPEFLMTGSGAPAVHSMEKQPLDRLIPRDELVGNNDFPIFAAAMGGEGHIIVTFEPIEYAKRPEPLRHVRDGYGLLITGGSMVPAFRPGDTALVHPRLPPERGTDVILYHTPPDGEAEATVKHLVGFNDREWSLEQYDPAKTFTVFRKEWPVCHRVVGKYSRR